jgi:hypothetical protein
MNTLVVFLASPGDANEERRRVAAVVTKINRRFRGAFDWQIELRGWEDTLPGYARPQSLINSDIDDCDVFVGILWK